MTTSTLLKFAAIAVGLGLFVTPAAARDHSRHGDFWWESSGYSGDPYDEYSYPGIRWYGDDCGFGYGGDYGYRRHRHAHDRGGHHRRGRHSGRHHRGHWRYDRERNDWR